MGSKDGRGGAAEGGVLFAHKIVRYAGGRWKANHALRFHLRTISKNADLKDAKAFAYFGLIQRQVQSRREGFPENVVPLYISNEKNGTHDKFCSNMATAEMAREGDENSAIDEWLN